MHLYDSSKDYLFHLQTTSSADAKRMWRQSIKDKWNHKCAYCGNTEYLTIDHVIPQCKGGTDLLENVVDEIVENVVGNIVENEVVEPVNEVVTEPIETVVLKTKPKPKAKAKPYQYQKM